MEVLKSALMASGGMPSGPATFPFYQTLDGSLDLCFIWLFSLTSKGSSVVLYQASRLTEVY